MRLRITKLERGTRTAKSSGNVQQGLYVYGVKLDQYGNDEKNWERFLTDQHDANSISMLEQIGIGNTAKINMVQNGKYWNVGSIEHDVPNSGGGSPAPANSGGGQPGGSPSYSQAGKAPAQDTYRKPEEIIRVNALNAAIGLTRHMIDLNGQEKMKIYAAKTSTELIEQGVLDLAKKFEDFIKGNDGSATESSTQDVGNPVDAEEPGLPGEEKIPY